MCSNSSIVCFSCHNFLSHSTTLDSSFNEAILKSTSLYYFSNDDDPTNIVFSDENESPVEHPENSGFKNQERAEWTKHRTEIQKGVYFSFTKTGTCLKKSCNFIHFNLNAAYPDYSSESAARNAMSYPRGSLLNVNKDELLTDCFPGEYQVTMEDLLLTLVEARKVEVRIVMITSQNSVSVLSIQAVADMVSSASSVM